jgi:hypothetical protein
MIEGSIIFSGAYESGITLGDGTYLTGGSFPLSITIKDFRTNRNPLIFPGSTGLDIVRDIGSMRVYLPAQGTGVILLQYAAKYGLNCAPSCVGDC